MSTPILIIAGSAGSHTGKFIYLRIINDLLSVESDQVIKPLMHSREGDGHISQGAMIEEPFNPEHIFTRTIPSTSR